MIVRKSRFVLMVLALVLVVASLTVMPAESDKCPLEACAEECDQVCAPNGGEPASCVWLSFPAPGHCSALCRCY